VISNDAGARFLEEAGVVVLGSSLLQKYVRHKYLPFKYELGVTIGLLLMALGAWMVGSFPMP
jgi:hypothetical protein